MVRRVPLVDRQPQARLVLVAPGPAGATPASPAPSRPTGARSSPARPGSSTRRPASTTCTCSPAKQPDLNWENPEVRAGGLRDDALVARPRRRRLPHGRHQHDLQGHVPCPTATCPARVARTATARRTSSAARGSTSSCRRCTARCSPAATRTLLTVGEMPGVTVERGAAVHRPGRGTRSTWCSSSSTCGLDQGDTKWDVRPLRPARPQGRRSARWQAGLADVGWNTLYWSNHDQPRVGVAVRRRRRAPGRARRRRSATVLHLHRGTPYVYQGEELGMTNAPFAAIERLPRHRVAQPLRRGDRRPAPTRPRVLAALRSDEPRQRPHPGAVGRLAGRRLHHRHAVDRRQPQPHRGQRRRRRSADPDSVFHHYRRLIELRHDGAGRRRTATSRCCSPDDPAVYAFTRRARRRRAAGRGQLLRRAGPARRCPGSTGGSGRSCSSATSPTAPARSSRPGRPGSTGAPCPPGPSRPDQLPTPTRGRPLRELAPQLLEELVGHRDLLLEPAAPLPGRRRRPGAAGPRGRGRERPPGRGAPRSSPVTSCIASRLNPSGFIRRITSSFSRSSAV